MHGAQLGFGLFGALQGGFQGRVYRVGEVVAFAQLEIVEIARWQVERGLEVDVFVGEEEAVEAVEQDVGVASVGHQVFPGVVALPWGFDEDDPGAEAAEVHAAQDGFFVALDVDFQEVDRPLGGVFFADRSQCACVDGQALHVHAKVFAFLRDDRVSGGQAGVGNAVESQFARLVAGHALQRGVAGAMLAEGVVVILHRFDVDALPAVIVEGLGDRVVDRVIGADVDVKTVFKILQGAPEANVLEILCVRNERHGRFLSVRFFLFGCALPARHRSV